MKNMFKNPWAKGGEYYPEELLDVRKVLENNAIKDFIKSLINLNDTPNNSAQKLAINDLFVEGLQNFQDQDWSFFFSHNNNLAGSASRPKNKIDTVAKWNELYTNKQINARIALLELADLSADTVITNDNVDKIAKAYDKWSSGLFAIFQQVPTGGERTTYTCNIFVGEALYLSGAKTLQSKKYYSAKAIYNGQHPNLKEVYPKISIGTDKKWDTADDICEVKAGDIWAKGGTHLEVVTLIKEKDRIFFPFCSRGGGRNSNQGEEKCGQVSFFTKERYVNHPDYKFFRIK